MTKMHFEYAADIIASSAEDVATKRFAAAVVIQMAQRFNPRFDRARFLRACGLEN